MVLALFGRAAIERKNRMKSFLASLVAILVIAGASAAVLTSFDRSSQRVYSSEFVRR